MSNRSLQFLIYVTIGIVAFVIGIAVMQFANSGVVSPMSVSGSTSCNISLIKTEGALYTYTFVPSQGSSNSDSSSPTDGAVDAGEITKAISDADANPAINAIVLQIDSGGGGVVAGEEIANALKRAKKPTVALIRAQGLSAAYWAATGAQKIFASANSEVGSIGVTASYVDQAKYNEKQGYTFHQVSSGEYKDVFNSNKPMSEKEHDLEMHEIEMMMQNFVHTVSVNRNIPEETMGADIKDAGIFVGNDALERKLIDQIGDRESVRAYLAGVLNKPLSDVTYCQ